MNKTITVKDLISKKEEIKNRKNETTELFVKSLEGNITIKKPDRQLCLEAIEMEDTQRADIFVVYNCVVEPDLRNGDLAKAFDLVEPDEIVAAIFEPGEITNISKECLKFAGYLDSVEVIKDLKN